MTPESGSGRTGPGWLWRDGGQSLGGEDHIGQVGDGFFQRRVGVAGVFPNLVGERGEVHFVVFRVVEDAGFFGEKVADEVVVFFVLEKGFVGADDLGVFLQALADARAQADEALDAIGGQKRVAENFLRLLADAIHAARALDEADDGPRQIEVHDDGGVLKVLAFAENIGGDQNAKFVAMAEILSRALLLSGLNRRAKVGRVFGVAGDAGQLLEAARLQLVAEVEHGVGELGEDEDLLVGMLLRQEILEFGQLVILVGLPVAGELQDGKQPFGVLPEMLGKVFDEDIRAQPIEIVRGARALSKCVAAAPALAKSASDLAVISPWARLRLVVIVEHRTRSAVAVVVIVAGVEKSGVLGADGQRQAVFQRVKVNKIAQDVAADGEQERVAAAFEPLEKIRAAEADEALAGAGEILHHFGFVGSGRHVERGLEVIGEAVARQVQHADGVHDLVGIEPGVLVVRVVVADAKVSVFGWRLGK